MTEGRFVSPELRISPLRSHRPNPPLAEPQGADEGGFVVEWQLEAPAFGRP